MSSLTDTQREKAVAKLMDCFGAPEVRDEDIADFDIMHEVEHGVNEIIYPGVIITFKSTAAQNEFIALAKKLFAKTRGNHAVDGEVKPDYSFAIKRQPWEKMSTTVISSEGQYEIDSKVYPLHLSDAALKVLTQPKNIKKIKASYTPKEIDSPESPYADTAGHKVVDLRSRKPFKGDEREGR